MRAIHPHRRGAACLRALGWLIVASPVPVNTAWAQAEVRVRAGTRIDLHAEQDAGTARVAGRLLDDVDRPVAGALISLAVRERSTASRSRLTLTTDTHGAFVATFASPPDAVQVAAEYAGDAFHDPSEQAVVVDSMRAPVRIVWTPAPDRRFDLDAPAQHVAFRAESSAGGSGLAVELRDELGRVLARGQTDATGRFAVALKRGVLGAPGAGTLSARSAADGSRSEGYAEASIIRFRPSRIEAGVQVDAGELRIEGLLRDTRGGLAHKAIGVFASDAHVATVWTDQAGKFVLRRPAPRDSVNAAAVDWEVRFESDAPWIGSSHSDRLRVAHTDGGTSRLTWILMSMGVSALLLAATRSRSRPERAAAVTPRETPGIHAAKRRRLFGTRHSEVAGQALDATRGNALPSARVELRAPTGLRIAVPVDARGCFASGPLPEGPWTLLVEAEGYATGAARIDVPHRGEWLDLRVHLESLRAAAERRYRPVAGVLLPEAALWYFWSARETLAYAEATGRFSALLTRLTERVERACYARDTPSLAELEAIAEDATTLTGSPSTGLAQPADPR